MPVRFGRPQNPDPRRPSASAPPGGNRLHPVDPCLTIHTPQMRRPSIPIKALHFTHHQPDSVSMIPEAFWQEILPPDSCTTGGYPARFEDGRILLLPLRPLSQDG